MFCVVLLRTTLQLLSGATALQSARWLAGAYAIVASDATPAADADFDERPAIRAVVRFKLVQSASFGFALAGSAALRAENRFEAFGVNRLAAHFAENRGLPIVDRIIERRTGRQAFLLAQRTCHPRRGFDQQLGDYLTVRLAVAPQKADDAQPGNRVVAAADGPPMAVSTVELVGEHRHSERSEESMLP